MPSFADSAVIFILALILFGPKKLPQLARQLGKLMAEFRRASNEFRMQMEDELRIEEQKEHQKKVDAMAGPPSTLPEPEHPHLPSPAAESSTVMLESDASAGEYHAETVAESAPIAESGSLRMMPPSTGLPVESRTYTTGRDLDFTYHDGDAAETEYESDGHHAIPEHTILPPAVGMSSEEPAEETRVATSHEAVHSA